MESRSGSEAGEWSVERETGEWREWSAKCRAEVKTEEKMESIIERSEA